MKHRRKLESLKVVLFAFVVAWNTDGGFSFLIGALSTSFFMPNDFWHSITPQTAFTYSVHEKQCLYFHQCIQHKLLYAYWILSLYHRKLPLTFSCIPISLHSTTSLASFYAYASRFASLIVENKNFEYCCIQNGVDSIFSPLLDVCTVV